MASKTVLSESKVWAVVGLGAIILSLTFGLYTYKFGSIMAEPDSAVWGQLGDFIGGITNPLLAFLSLLAISYSIILQIGQASTANADLITTLNELKLTREELARTAAAQEAASTTLQLQIRITQRGARLAAIIALINHHTAELSRITAEYSRPPEINRAALEHRQKLEILNTELEKFYQEIEAKEAAMVPQKPGGII